jgi:hypothetical protein
MKTRDQYVAKLKGRLDLWNARIAQFEKSAGAAQSQQLKEYRAQRERALYNLKLLENASTAAWQDLAKGADEAWSRIQAAFDDARNHFEKTPPKAKA